MNRTKFSQPERKSGESHSIHRNFSRREAKARFGGSKKYTGSASECVVYYLIKQKEIVSNASSCELVFEFYIYSWLTLKEENLYRAMLSQFTPSSPQTQRLKHSTHNTKQHTQQISLHTRTNTQNYTFNTSDT